MKKKTWLIIGSIMLIYAVAIICNLKDLCHK